MNLIVCLDNNYGLLFNNRRLSRDREIIKDIIDNEIKDSKLYIKEYSKELFDIIGVNDNIEILEKDTTDIEWLFIEDNNFIQEKINKIIVYYWNKVYPSDVKFKIDLSLWKEIESSEIKGYSHDNIIKKEYIRG